MEKIHRLRSITIGAKWKTITAIVIVAIASFSIGAFANQVVVQQVQSVGGKHVLVPAPELQINSTLWNINGTSSMITGVTLHVITVGGPSGVTKLYQLFVQVSCLNAANVSFTCATGNGTIVLLANGGSGTLLVPVSPQIDPELTEVDDLSFIVTGTPVPMTNCPPGATPGFTLTATPTFVFLNRSISTVATVTKTLTSTCGFSGTVSFTASSTPAGLTIAFSATTITLPANGAATVTEAIAATTPGNFTITNTATSGTTTHSVTITLEVV